MCSHRNSYVQDIVLISSYYNCRKNHCSFRFRWPLRDQAVRSAKTANMSPVEKLGHHVVIRFMVSLCDDTFYIFPLFLSFTIFSTHCAIFKILFFLFSLTATDGASERLKYV